MEHKKGSSDEEERARASEKHPSKEKGRNASSGRRQTGPSETRQGTDLDLGSFTGKKLKKGK